MNRTIAILSVLLVVAVAGCMGFGSGSGDGPTPTPASPPGEDLGNLPPGVIQGGIEDVDELLDAHTDTLNDSDYQMQFETTDGDQRSRIEVEYDGSASLATVESEGSTVTSYASGERVFSRAINGDRTVNGYGYNASGGPLFADQRLTVERQYLDRILSRGLFAPEEWTTRQGEQQLRLTATEVPEPDEEVEGTVIVDLDVELYVTQDGLIRELSGSFTQETEGETVEGELSYEVENRASVDRPRWTGDVTQIDATLTDDRRLLRIEHRGGPSVGAFSMFQIGDPAVGQVVIEQELARGDTLYVHMGADDEEVTATRERPAVEDLPTFDRHVTVLVQGSNTQIRVTAGPE